MDGGLRGNVGSIAGGGNTIRTTYTRLFRRVQLIVPIRQTEITAFIVRIELSIYFVKLNKQPKEV